MPEKKGMKKETKSAKSAKTKPAKAEAIEGECCPKFNPKLWDNKTHEWKNKPFVKDSMHTFFHMPCFSTINKKMTNLWNMINTANAVLPKKDETLILFYDPSAFRTEIYWSVSKKVKGAENVMLSGKFVSKVFDGKYSAIPKFIKQMDEYLAKSKKKAMKYYVHYAYCPKCAKKYGNNYIVIFAQVE